MPSDKEIIKLGKKDVALVIRDKKDKFSIETYLPKMKEEDVVSDNSLTVCLLGIMFTQKDKDLIKLLNEKRKKYFMELTIVYKENK